MLTAEEALAPLSAWEHRVELRQLVDAYPSALGEPRQQARFLCGLGSPATTSARLSRHPLFGALQVYPFGGVLACLAEWNRGPPQTPVTDRNTRVGYALPLKVKAPR